MLPLGNATTFLTCNMWSHSSDIPTSRFSTGILLWLALTVALVQHRETTAGLRENFESPETSWRVAAADAPYRLRQHARTDSQSHWGHGSEHIRVAVGAGTYLFLEHEIEQPRVIDELLASVWIKSERPNIQLFARVVYPRTTDEEGQPVTALIQGTSYSDVGAWQRLSLSGVPDLVAEQARVLRLQLQRDVDTREAYLDRILLNIYSSPGIGDVFIDDLEIEGHVPVAGNQPFNSRDGVRHAPFESVAVGGASTKIELRGAVLLVDGKPVFPRVIEHRGESFEFLKRLGFNAIQLQAPPTPWQLAEAERQQVWLVAPPPDVHAGRSINSSHQRVLCWNLGNNLTGQQVAQSRDLAFAVRRADEQSGRPLLAHANEQLRSYSRIANVMLFSRQPLGTSFQLADYQQWLQTRQQLLRPGTPSWAHIQTEPPAVVLQQADFQGFDLPPNVELQQIRLLAMSAVAAGARGLIFTSRNRLDGNDETSLLRAQTLELVNRELDLIEPWLAVSGHAAPVAVREEGVTASMFATQHSQLILLTQIADQSQHVIAPPRTRQMSLVVPGVPESSDAYVLTPTGLRPLAHRRVTGGIGVALTDLDWASMILFTSDPLAYARLAQTVGRDRSRTAQLRLATTIQNLQRTKTLLAARPNTARDLTSSMGLIETNLTQGQRMLAAGDPAAASTYSHRASYSLAGLRRQRWEETARASRVYTSPTETALSFAGNPQSTGNPQGRNHVPSGNMESISKLMQSGWRNFRREQSGVSSTVELSPVVPNTGQFSLRLQATRGGQQAAAQLESPPVWIRSPAQTVHPGQAYIVQGWLRVDAPLAGSLDGVMIYDSHQGRDVAVRVQQTSGWQPFRIKGVAIGNKPLWVNIEMTGIGEAFIDDIEVLLPQDGEAFQQPNSPQQPSSTAGRLRNLIRLPR